MIDRRRESHLQRVVIGEVEQPTSHSHDGWMLAPSASSATILPLCTLTVGKLRATVVCSQVALMVPVANSEGVTPAATVSLRIAAALISLPKNGLRDWPQQTHQKAPNPPEFPLTHLLALAPLGGFGG